MRVIRVPLIEIKRIPNCSNTFCKAKSVVITATEELVTGKEETVFESNKCV